MRRLTFLLAALLLVLAAGSFVIWRWAAGQMRAQFDLWMQAQRAQGWRVTHAEPSFGGWPLAVAMTLPDLSLSGLDTELPQGVAWRGEQVTFRLGATTPRLLTVTLAGPQRLRLGANRPVGYRAARCVLSVPLPEAGPPRVLALDADGIAADGGVGIGLLQGRFERREQPAGLDVRLTAEAIAFPPPPAPQPALGAHIASATLEGTLTGRLASDAPDPAAAATAWRESGGRVVARRLALGWGPLGVSGQAELGLDAALQPEGSAGLHLVGYAETLQALAAAQVIAPRAAQAATAVLGLLATTPDGGGAPMVDVPLTLRDRAVQMGRIPLLRLPELVWPNTVEPAKQTP